MTSVQKKYQNVSYKELLEYAENNPNRNRKLDSIEILPSKTSSDVTLDKIGLKGYTAVTLNPSGILSLLLCIDDPNYYSITNKNTRIQQIIEIATKLQEDSDLLKNTEISRKRKKVYDLIGAAYNGTPFEEKDYLDLFCGISYLRNMHFVLMKEAIQEDIEEGHNLNGFKGEIVFSSNPIMWKKDNPIWIADYRAR